MEKDLEKYIISQEEVAIYEILAYSKEDAIEAFEAGDGDFVGWDESVEKELKVEKYDGRG